MSISSLDWIDDSVRRGRFHDQLDEFLLYVQSVEAVAAHNADILQDEFAGPMDVVELPDRVPVRPRLSEALKAEPAVEFALEQFDGLRVFPPAGPMWEWMRERANELVRQLKELDRKVADRGGDSSLATEAVVPLIVHDLGYRSVSWGEKQYQFSKKQGIVVETLANTRAPLPDRELLAVAGSSGRNLRDLFRRKKDGKTERHPAWGELIVPRGDGWRELAVKKIELPHVAPD